MKNNAKPKRAAAADPIFDIVDALIMAVVCVVIAYPLYYVLVASFTEPHIVTSGKFLLYPEQFYAGGYQRILKYPPIWSGYRNTVLYTVVGTVISLCVTIPAAYSLSRRDMAGRRFLMFLFTLTMFFSGGLIPLYMLIRGIGIYGSLWSVTLPTAVSVWNLIICRTFFETSLPFELYEAAELDGCSNFGFFFRVALPLSSTVVAVMILFYSTAQWNMFMNALMFLSDSDKMPLQVILRNLILINQVNQLSTDMTAVAEQQKLADQLKFGIIVVAALPLLCVYPFIQKYFARGIMIGSIKG
ncbi:MAG: carbohydrate ABC transporter permease [Clostridiales bacterium]|jgi:putative aldouronate transport system permease protein|nr:carbohydrate ABC transporter permease [Clostridiales bacterium]